jgi:hypothetical protein
MICKTCKKELHICSICDPDNFRKNGYCNQSCFEKGLEHKWLHKYLNSLWTSLNDKQKLDLWVLWDNGFLMEGIFEEYIDEIIVDIRDEDGI